MEEEEINGRRDLGIGEGELSLWPKGIKTFYGEKKHRESVCC